MQLEISSLSRPGGRAVNEDACGIWSCAGACFCVVSDGAGGHGGGDVASRLAVKHALEWFRHSPVCSGEAVAAALGAANRAVVDAQRSGSRCADMRATAVVLAVDTLRGVAAWGHLGDSRLYCFRRRRIVAQTRDHSVVQNMVEAGYLQAAQLRASPERSKLLAALGDARSFDPSIGAEDFPLEDGDVFLLCTDGLWEYAIEAEMQRTLAQSGSMEAWLRALEARVLANGREGQDNYSAVAVACKMG